MIDSEIRKYEAGSQHKMEKWMETTRMEMQESLEVRVAAAVQDALKVNDTGALSEAQQPEMA